MAKHIGIVACSSEGAALCYRTICAEAPARMGRHDHPEVTMHTFPLDEYMQHIYDGEWDRVGDMMADSARKLAACGAELAICPDNTIHQAYDRAVELSPIPWLHIAQVVADEATRQGRRHLGVLGTRYLMEGPVYADALAAAGVEMSIPPDDDRERINAIIFDELVCGRFTDESRTYFETVIAALARGGADAVVLGCTEIPLLVDPARSPLPTLDSTRLLARAALREALA